MPAADHEVNMYQRFGGRACLVPVMGVTLGLALPAAAQQPTPKVEVSVGYVVVRDQDIYRETFPLGWNIDVATQMTRRLTIVGEVGGAYRHVDLLGTGFDLSVHTLMAGPRLSGWQSGRLAPFAHILVGGALVRASVFGERSSTIMLALQPGAGVDVRLTDLVGVRIGGDYRLSLSGGAEIEFRVGTGAVFRVGRK